MSTSEAIDVRHEFALLLELCVNLTERPDSDAFLRSVVDKLAKVMKVDHAVIQLTDSSGRLTTKAESKSTSNRVVVRSSFESPDVDLLVAVAGITASRIHSDSLLHELQELKKTSG